MQIKLNTDIEGIAYELGVVFKIELVQYTAAIGADGIGAELYLPADLGDGLASRQQLKDLQLSV